MFIESFSTRSSRLAAGGLLLLLMVGVPLVNGLVEDDGVQWGLFYAIALLAGCGMGWVAGDAFANSSLWGRIVIAASVLAVAFLCFFFPSYAIARRAGAFDAVSLLHALFGNPLQSGSATGVISYAAVAFLLCALIAAVVATRKAPSALQRASTAAHIEETTPDASLDRRYNAMIAWGTVGSACGTGVAVLALAFALVQLTIAENRWQKEVTVKAISDENIDKPYASRHCLQALNSLDNEQLKKLTRRERVELGAPQKEAMDRCFADQDETELRKVYDADGSLKPKGSALLAQRVNYTLIKDGLIASLLKYRIGDRSLVTSELHSRLCKYDKPVVERLNKVDLPDYPGTTIFSKDDSLLWLVTSKFCN